MKKQLKVLLPLTLAITAIAAIAAIAGHAGTAKSAPTASTAASAARCVKYAGVESSGNKNSMDPAQQPSSQNSLNMNASYDRLTTENDNWKVLPDLATSWKPNANGTAWTFKLHKGVKFWDGKPLTSADVVYTFRRVIDPKTGSEGASQMSFLTKNGKSFAPANPIQATPATTLTPDPQKTFFMNSGDRISVPCTTQSMGCRPRSTTSSRKPSPRPTVFRRRPNCRLRTSYFKSAKP